MNAYITKLAFETDYSDGSGPQFAVRYDRDGDGSIEFECIDTVTFPVSQVGWLIECLDRIKKESEVKFIPPGAAP